MMRGWPNIHTTKPPEVRMREAWKVNEDELIKASYVLFLRVLQGADVPVTEGIREWFNDIYPFKLRAAEAKQDVEVLINSISEILAESSK
jgi:hypothetical protein